MGGAAGHMAHLHENVWMTIGEIKEFLRKVASAELQPFEKVDGQNIFFRWSPEGLMTARNATDISKGGMTEKEYRAKFAGHPAEKPFIQGFETIKTAMKKMPDEEARKAFNVTTPGGYRFVNAEIMLPESENIIVYDGSYIVLHNLKEYSPIGPKGKMAETDVFMNGEKEFDSVVEAISDVEKTKNKTEWQVFGPRFIELKDLLSHKSYKAALKIFDKLKLKDDDKLSDYIQKKLEEKIDGIPEEKKEQLIKRVVMIGEKYSTSELPNLNVIKKGLSSSEKAIVSDFGSVTKARSKIKAILVPIAKVISDFAIEVLRGLHSFFMTDGDKEVERMRKTLIDSIKKLENYKGDDAEKYGILLQAQMEKLGEIENIASTVEGVIFEYPPGSKQLVKLTGSFAMANQIIGRAKRLKESIDMQESDNIEEILIESQDFDSVAVIPGAFKPPHLGHVAMVDHYEKLADKVYVYISNPKKAKSQRSIDGYGNVTAEMSLKLWKVLLGNRENVTVEISEEPSPVTVAYDSVMPANPAKNYDGTPFKDGTTVYLGCSAKGGDAKRYKGAIRVASPNIEVPDPAENAAPASTLSQEFIEELNNSEYKDKLPSSAKGLDPKEFSASDLRFLLGKSTSDPVAKSLASYYVGGDNIDKYMKVLGMLSESYRKRNKYSLKTLLF